jgi:DMSO reductase iron-sulfur subunit
VRLTEDGLAVVRSCSTGYDEEPVFAGFPSLIPARPLEEGEQYRFHFNMTKCIGCRSCEVACNEQNGNPAAITWRRIGELESGSYPDTHRHYLSMGCNHCVDAECVRGCPVDAYTKDPVTGIVLHSADACIGCQYCVWNCPYSVPQFNPERGVVGKCDMCRGRLDEGLEPACVNACPEAAIEIEIVNIAEWRANYSAADSPGMPSAGHTVSTTRITLPEQAAPALERVDSGQIRPEHAHWSLVFMTTLMQAVAGALTFLLLRHALDAVRLLALLAVTGVALTLSTTHLGRPAYAWRALKMWRRSWLSREVLLFTLFAFALTAATFATAAAALHHPVVPRLIMPLDWAAAVFGIAGTLASAYIYLVPARPSWNMLHTPVDFLLTAGMLGAFVAAVLNECHAAMFLPVPLHALDTAKFRGAQPVWPAAVFALAWILNHAVRIIRLRRSSLFEERASHALLASEPLRTRNAISFGLVPVAILFLLAGHPVLALVVGWAAALIARYLFFVSVVPLNMALTFIRARAA